MGYKKAPHNIVQGYNYEPKPTIYIENLSIKILPK